MKINFKLPVIPAFLFVISFLYGCEQVSSPAEKQNEINRRADEWKLLVKDGCEYYSIETYGPRYVAVHSGTCHNKIHPENWNTTEWRKKLGLSPIVEKEEVPNQVDVSRKKAIDKLSNFLNSLSDEEKKAIGIK